MYITWIKFAYIIFLNWNSKFASVTFNKSARSVLNSKTTYFTDDVCLWMQNVVSTITFQEMIKSISTYRISSQCKNKVPFNKRYKNKSIFKIRKFKLLEHLSTHIFFLVYPKPSNFPFWYFLIEKVFEKLNPMLKTVQF